MRPSKGTHNVARLRALLGRERKELREQKGFSDAVGISVTTLHKVETEKRSLSLHLAERISDRTGISPKWLLENRQDEPPYDRKGGPYTLAHYERAQVRRMVPPDLKAPILVRSMLLGLYAEARDLFLRPEMYRHLFRFFYEAKFLVGRYAEEKADWPDTMRGADFIEAENKRRATLYLGVIRDAERCQKAEEEAKKFEREKAEKLEREKGKRLAPFLSGSENQPPRATQKRVERRATARKR